MGSESSIIIDAWLRMHLINYSDPIDLNVTSHYLEENEAGLLASIECDFSFSNSTGVLVELILSAKGKIYIEQISSYRGEFNA